MTELAPLLQASSDEVELALLRSTERDEPSAYAMARTAAAMGLGASLTTAALEAAAADAGGSVLASAGSAPIWISALKALTVGTISGTLIATAAHAVFSESAVDHATDSRRADAKTTIARQKVEVQALPSAQLPKYEPTGDLTSAGANPDGTRALSPGQTRSVTARSRGAAAPPALASAVAGSPSSPYPHDNAVASSSGARAAYQSLPVTSATRTTDRVPTPNPALAHPAPQASAPAAPVSIADEVAAIESARHALSAGRAREALAELQRYRARWPTGVFSAEALVLRVQAKIKLGDRASAVREANALINAQPNSRHASRLRALLGISTTE